MLISYFNMSAPCTYRWTSMRGPRSVRTTSALILFHVVELAFITDCTSKVILVSTPILCDWFIVLSNPVRYLSDETVLRLVSRPVLHCRVPHRGKLLIRWVFIVGDLWCNSGPRLRNFDWGREQAGWPRLSCGHRGRCGPQEFKLNSCHATP